MGGQSNGRRGGRNDHPSRTTFIYTSRPGTCCATPYRPVPFGSRVPSIGALTRLSRVDDWGVEIQTPSDRSYWGD
jgi:hypothetical protein